MGLPRRFLLFGGAVVLLHAVFSPAAAGQERIRLSHSALEANNAVWYIAKDLGFYKKNGLDAELLFIPSTTTSVVSLVSGDVQIAHASGGGVASAVVAGSCLSPAIKIHCPTSWS